MVSVLDKLKGQRAKLDEQLQGEEAKAAIAEHAELMRQREEVAAKRDAEMGKLFLAEQSALAKAQEARALADKLAGEYSVAFLYYRTRGPVWANQLAEIDNKIRETRPQELNSFISWLDEYSNALTGAYTVGSPLGGQRDALAPRKGVKGADGSYRDVVDKEKLAATREELRIAREKALELAVTASPEKFLPALAQLRSGTEMVLLKLRS